VRKIGRLYAPVALGIGFSMFGTTIDRRLGSSAEVGDAAITYMRWATTLVQFTLGMVAAAISVAILPTLSRLDSAGDEAGFRRVFGLGLKTVLLLSVPAMVMLGLFGEPIVRLLFQYGPRTPENTRMTTLALWGYLPSILAVAIDQPLLFAFYARKHTLLPNLVQGLAVLAYCIVAFLSYRQWGMFGLIAANVVQLSTHALVMIWLGHRHFRLFDGQHFIPAAAKIAVAALVMIATGWGLRQLFATGPLSISEALLIVAVPGGLASLAYFGILWVLRFDALVYTAETIRKKLKRS
jgi:putative peptidoglycan lipid II flippase